MENEPWTLSLERVDGSPIEVRDGVVRIVRPVGGRTARVLLLMLGYELAGRAPVATAELAKAFAEAGILDTMTLKRRKTRHLFCRFGWRKTTQWCLSEHGRRSAKWVFGHWQIVTKNTKVVGRKG